MERLDRRRPYWRTEHDDESADTIDFQDAHRSLSDRVERVIMQLVILGLVALVLVQTLHTNTTARRMLSLVEALEGVPWTQVAAWREPGTAAQTAQTPSQLGQSGPSGGPSQPGRPGQPQTVAAAGESAGRVTLTVISRTKKSPGAKLLVDGKVAGNFAEGSVTAEVKPGQAVTVDGSAVSERLEFVVVGGASISSPELGFTVTTQGNSKPLGVVKVSQE